VKEISLPAGTSGFDVRYVARNEGRSPLDALLAVEFVLALLAGNAPDRYLLHEGENVGPLVSRLDLSPSVRVGARDEWSNLEVDIGFDEAVPVWTFPLRTVSLSESGLESVYQGTIVLPRWRLRLGPGEDREITIRYRILPVRR
jgi:alpha-amylase